MLEPTDTSTRSPLAAGSRLLVDTAFGPIAIFGTGDTVHAIEDGCLRCGTTLVTGALEGAVVSCRTCGWRYDVTSGCLVGLPALRIATYRIGAYPGAPAGPDATGARPELARN